MEIIGRNSEFCRNFPLLTASNLICRKSPLSMEILFEWLDFCMREPCITPPLDGDHDEVFRWFCAEQSVLNQVIARRIERGDLPWFYPGICIGRGFTPSLTDNSHASRLATTRSPLGLAKGRTKMNWHQIEAKLTDWKPAHDLKIIDNIDGGIILCDGDKSDYHLLRLVDLRAENAPVRISVTAKPASGCSVGLHVQLWGGRDVVTFDSNGRIIDNKRASRALCMKLSNGYSVFEVEFFNLHETLMIGLGNPQGFYEGHNREQYILTEIDVKYGTESCYFEDDSATHL